MVTYGVRWDGYGFVVHLCWMNALKPRNWISSSTMAYGRVRRYKSEAKVLKLLENAEAVMFFLPYEGIETTGMSDGTAQSEPATDSPETGMVVTTVGD